MKITIETGNSEPITAERASWNMKMWFVAMGMFNLMFATFCAFGPWWCKIGAGLGFIMAGLCFHTAWKEHKKPFYKD